MLRNRIYDRSEKAMIIKNIALAGHAGTGKTTLLEALLYQGGCVERMGLRRTA